MPANYPLHDGFARRPGVVRRSEEQATKLRINAYTQPYIDWLRSNLSYLHRRGYSQPTTIGGEARLTPKEWCKLFEVGKVYEYMAIMAFWDTTNMEDKNPELNPKHQARIRRFLWDMYNKYNNTTK